MSPAARGRGGGGSSSYNLRGFVELLRDRYCSSWRRSNNVVNISSAANSYNTKPPSSSGDDNGSCRASADIAKTTQKGLQLISCKNWAESLFLGPPPSSLPPPSRPPPSPRYGFSGWAKWLLGTILTVVLPFWKQKWERLKTIEGEAEIVAEQVESVAEIVEQVATVAENVSAEVAESIPGSGGKLKEAALMVERVSKVTAHEAHVAREFLHKVDKLKDDLDELEKMVEPKPSPPSSPTRQYNNAQGRL
ncbi:unnamed protein product [Linum trigynum]|uniref:Peroxin-14 n=1 Tax=Linum trigynum TaxID=586398 RepID=A0AAV2C7W8_9ROSI